MSAEKSKLVKDIEAVESAMANAAKAKSSCAAPAGWEAVCDDNLPPLDEIVWLWDGKRIWLGGRADVPDGEGWLWGNTYGSIWRRKDCEWEGDLETDDDYKPTHWMRLPEPPNDAGTKTP